MLQPQQPTPAKLQHLILVGGGHAHVQVIKALNDRALPEHVRVTLIDPQAAASYSGMVPGCISGQYSPDETKIDLVSLAKWAGMDFVQDRVVDIDVEEQIVYLDSSEALPYDAISLDIGSTARGLDTVPGAREYAIPTRPIDKLIDRLEQARMERSLPPFMKSSTKPPAPVKLVVVGGGVAGIELSMSVTTRWRHEFPVECTLLDAGAELLPYESLACREQLKGLLRDEKQISVRHHCQIREINATHVLLDPTSSSHNNEKEAIEYTHCIWATGAAAHPLAKTLGAKRGLDTTERHWIRVGSTLQSTSHPSVFAAGDCAHIQTSAGSPPPKAGVFAVRAGPVLIDNLPRYLASLQQLPPPLTNYTPQSDFLKLLVCGDGVSLGFRFGIPLYGKWVFQMKDAIDKNFMDLFHPAYLPNKITIRPGQYDTSQYDDSDNEKDDNQKPKEQPDRLSPEVAASLIQRSDDEVDFQSAWRVIRTMSQDDSYRLQVLDFVQKTTADATL